VKTLPNTLLNLISQSRSTIEPTSTWIRKIAVLAAVLESQPRANVPAGGEDENIPETVIPSGTAVPTDLSSSIADTALCHWTLANDVLDELADGQIFKLLILTQEAKE
jgi:hypothetical protein